MKTKLSIELEEMAKLLSWSYEEGYKAAMKVIEMVASDRSADQKALGDIQQKMIDALEQKYGNKDLRNQ